MNRYKAIIMLVSIQAVPVDLMAMTPRVAAWNEVSLEVYSLAMTPSQLRYAVKTMATRFLGGNELRGFEWTHLYDRFWTFPQYLESLTIGSLYTIAVAFWNAYRDQSMTVNSSALTTLDNTTFTISTPLVLPPDGYNATAGALVIGATGEGTLDGYITIYHTLAPLTYRFRIDGVRFMAMTIFGDWTDNYVLRYGMYAVIAKTQTLVEQRKSLLPRPMRQLELQDSFANPQNVINKITSILNSYLGLPIATEPMTLSSSGSIVGLTELLLNERVDQTHFNLFISTQVMIYNNLLDAFEVRSLDTDIFSAPVYNFTALGYDYDIVDCRFDMWQIDSTNIGLDPDQTTTIDDTTILLSAPDYSSEIVSIYLDSQMDAELTAPDYDLYGLTSLPVHESYAFSETTFPGFFMASKVQLLATFVDADSFYDHDETIELTLADPFYADSRLRFTSGISEHWTMGPADRVHVSSVGVVPIVTAEDVDLAAMYPALATATHVCILDYFGGPTGLVTLTSNDISDGYLHVEPLTQEFIWSECIGFAVIVLEEDLTPTTTGSMEALTAITFAENIVTAGNALSVIYHYGEESEAAFLLAINSVTPAKLLLANPIISDWSASDVTLFPLCFFYIENHTMHYLTDNVLKLSLTLKEYIRT